MQSILLWYKPPATNCASNEIDHQDSEVTMLTQITLAAKWSGWQSVAHITTDDRRTYTEIGSASCRLVKLYTYIERNNPLPNIIPAGSSTFYPSGLLLYSPETLFQVGINLYPLY